MSMSLTKWNEKSEYASGRVSVHSPLAYSPPKNRTQVNSSPLGEGVGTRTAGFIRVIPSCFKRQPFIQSVVGKSGVASWQSATICAAALSTACPSAKKRWTATP